MRKPIWMVAVVLACLIAGIVGCGVAFARWRAKARATAVVLTGDTPGTVEPVVDDEDCDASPSTCGAITP